MHARRIKMKEKAKAMVLASFVADSLALGAHWVYDTGRIKQSFGRVDKLLKPTLNVYHAGKGQGEWTHYGDQAFVLLESLAARKCFDLEDFSTRWLGLFDNYHGYYDEATKETLRLFSQGKGPEASGSPSQDLAGASRIAPVVYGYRNDLDTLLLACRAQTKMTHNSPLVIDSAEFFARVALKTLQGASPVQAMEEIAAQHFKNSPIFGWVRAGIESVARETVPAIARFGQSCHIEEAFPGTVHLIARYEGDLREALIQCVMCGGDSAARGMIVGLVLGAHLGEGAVPHDWISGLARGEEMIKLLDSLP